MRLNPKLKSRKFRKAFCAPVSLWAFLTSASVVPAQEPDHEQAKEEPIEYYRVNEPESRFDFKSAAPQKIDSASQEQSSAQSINDYLCQGQRIERKMQGSWGTMGGSTSDGQHSEDAQKKHEDSRPKEPPKITSLRWDEDYSYLCDFKNRTGASWERHKYIPLDSRGRTYLTLGDELRLRYIQYWDNQWGSATRPDEGYLRYRQLPYADLHIGPHFRLFGQLMSAYSTRSQLTRNPDTDQTGVDLLQGFADVRVLVGDDGGLTFRGGREVMAYGSQRLISTGPNIRFAFDGGLIRLDEGNIRLDAFYKRPVKHGLESFDDRTDPSRAIWALYATQKLPQISEESGVDLYYIGYENETAAFNQGEGDENRQTFGTRVFGTYGPWSWDLEQTVQVGDFSDAGIWAWSTSNGAKYQFEDVRLKPALGLRAAAISGDGNPDDNALGTFNAMFTNAEYFGDIGQLGPANLYALRGSLDLDFGSGWTFETVGYAFWRQSLGDGIYGSAIDLVRPDRGSDERFIGSQADFVLSWEVNRNLSFRGVYSLFKPGPFIEDTGPAETVQFVQGDMVFKW